jgi:hypothetical protein
MSMAQIKKCIMASARAAFLPEPEHEALITEIKRELNV